MKDNIQNSIIERLTFPCLRGTIGDWNYYNVLMSFKDVKRIDNHHEIKETKPLDEWLQRDISNRKLKIKEYLLKEDQRYFNSIIVGVYGDMPDWYSLNLSEVSKKFDLDLGDNIQDSLGVLSLTGNETLFTIDGQHRIEGIKLALEENFERFKNDEISVMLISHKNDDIGKIRTRKLFATINREAVKPSKNDLAIIDEVYAYNLIARDIYSKYSKFDGLIALTETPNLDRNNHKEFTNLLTLVEINKLILKLINYRQSRFTPPNLELRLEMYELTKKYWDFVIENINEYNDFFCKGKSLSNFRNAEKNKSLNLLFVPIGQKFIADLYCEFHKIQQLDILKEKINLINYDLYNGHFKKLFFNDVKNLMIMNNYRVCKKLALYLLGIQMDESILKRELCKAYGINELSEEFKLFKLPKKL